MSWTLVDSIRPSLSEDGPNLSAIVNSRGNNNIDLWRKGKKKKRENKGKESPFSFILSNSISNYHKNKTATGPHQLQYCNDFFIIYYYRDLGQQKIDKAYHMIPTS